MTETQTIVKTENQESNNGGSRCLQTLVRLHLGDCLEIMKEIPDGSVDLVLTDPPYGIGISKWDKIDHYDFLFNESISNESLDK